MLLRHYRFTMPDFFFPQIAGTALSFKFFAMFALKRKLVHLGNISSHEPQKCCVMTLNDSLRDSC